MHTQSFSSSSARTHYRTWLWCLYSCCCRRERRSSLQPSLPSGSRPPRSAQGAAGEAGFPTTAAGPAPPPSTCWSRRTRTVTGRRGPRRAGRATTRTRRRRRTRPQAPRVRLRVAPVWAAPGAGCSPEPLVFSAVRCQERSWGLPPLACRAVRPGYLKVDDPVYFHTLGRFPFASFLRQGLKKFDHSGDHSWWSAGGWHWLGESSPTPD